MGDCFINQYKKMNNESKIAFFTTIIFGLFVHLYKFTNTLLMHDSIYNFYSNQNVIGSGRWFLSVACSVSSYFDLPWVVGIMSLIIVAITSIVIIEVLEIKNKTVIILSSAMLVSFPALTETFFFEYTADGYMIAMLLASLTVYFTRMNQKNIYSICLAIVCICLSCGIYQAYLSFALVLSICYFVNQLTKDSIDKKDYFTWIIKQIIVYGFGLILYYVIWKLCLYFQNASINHYQGINEVGNITVTMLLNGLINTFKTFYFFFFEYNIFEHGLTFYALLNILFIISYVFIGIKTILNSNIRKKKYKIGLLVLCIIALPLFICIWNFTSSSVEYGLRMLYSIVILYIFSIELANRYFNIRMSDLYALLIVIIIFNNSIQANISYYVMDKCNMTTYSTAIDLKLRIESIDSSINKIMIVGDRINVYIEDKKIHHFTHMLENDILYDEEHTISYLNNVLNMDLENISEKQREEILKNEVLDSMECYPSKNCIKIINDVIVIKYGNK